MRYFFSIALIILTTINICAKSQQKGYGYIYSSLPNLIVDGIVTAEDETVISLSYSASQGEAIHLSSSTFISDEAGNRHRILSAEGIQLDTVTKITTRCDLHFRLHFTALPTHTKCIDLFGEFRGFQFSIYGLHERGYKLRIPKLKEKYNVKDVKPTYFEKGRSVIIGHVRGRDFRNKPKVESQHFYNVVNNSYKATWLNDSTFMFEVDLEHAIWDNIIIGGKYVQFFLCANDTLNIYVEHFQKYNETISYRNFSDSYCFDAMLNNGEYIEGSLFLDKLPQRAFEKELKRIKKQSIILLRYIANKHHLSSFEHYLLTNQQRLQLAYRYLFYYGHTDTQFTGRSKFLCDIPWQDSTLLFVRGWNQGFLNNLCSKTLADYFDKPTIPNEDIESIFPGISDVIMADLKRTMKKEQPVLQ